MTADMVVFGFSVLLIVYVLFGYPLLLKLWPGKRIQIFASEPAQYRSVSVILPVRDGERWIQQKLESIFSLDYPQDLLQIIVVSDGSTDRTEEIVRGYGDRILLLRNPHSGKATAINHALRYAAGEILFMTDVRQPIGIRALKILVACFDDPKVGVASGELIIRKSDNTEEEHVGLYWEYEKWIRKRHSAIDSVMGATGAIYAMRRKLARELPPGTLLDDVQLPLSAFFQGYRILFVEEARAYDNPTALNQEFHRKVRTLAGVYQVLSVYPQLLGPQNRMWIHFVSHKLGRLLLPYLLLTALISSFFLPFPLGTLAVAAQAIFYVVALVDPWVPPSPMKRLSSLARTFVVLMWATLCASSILFRSGDSLWKPAR